VKIVILSRKTKTYFNDKFIEETNRCFKSDIEIEILDPVNCQLCIENGNYLVFYKNRHINNVDILIPQLSGSALDYGVKVIKHFEKSGIKVINSSDVIDRCKNKFEVLQQLQDIKGISIPKSILIKNPKELKSAVNLVGGLPVVIKMTSVDNKSLGSLLVNNISYAESFLDINLMLDNFTQIGQSIIVQEYIKDTSGRSTNHVLLGKDILASYTNTRTIVNNMISNPVNPETSDIIELSDQNRNLILKVREQFQLEFGIISLLESSLGQFIFKVNPLPDIEELEKIHKLGIVSKLIDHIAYAKKQMQD